MPDLEPPLPMSLAAPPDARESPALPPPCDPPLLATPNRRCRASRSTTNPLGHSPCSTPAPTTALHCEPWHAAEPLAGGAGQTLVQEPQCLALVVKSTHEPPQRVCVPQSAAQVPLAQTWPVAQDLPQLPQLPCEPLVSTHTPFAVGLALGATNAVDAGSGAGRAAGSAIRQVCLLVEALPLTQRELAIALDVAFPLLAHGDPGAWRAIADLVADGKPSERE